MFSDNYFNSDNRQGVRFGIGPIEPEEKRCEICNEEAPTKMYGMAELCQDCAEQAGLEVDG